MGPLCFDLGFGPFRWVVTSGLDSDLMETDRIASDVLTSMLDESDSFTSQQISDNLHWIAKADEHKLVVGSKARILYADDEGRRSPGHHFINKQLEYPSGRSAAFDYANL